MLVVHPGLKSIISGTTSPFRPFGAMSTILLASLATGLYKSSYLCGHYSAIDIGAQIHTLRLQSYLQCSDYVSYT
jgi:hypothetical protein